MEQGTLTKVRRNLRWKEGEHGTYSRKGEGEDEEGKERSTLLC